MWFNDDTYVQLLEQAMMKVSVCSVEAVEGDDDAGMDMKADESIPKFYA